MKDKLLPLISVGFPGGYKFFVVLLVTTFSGDMVANEFSKIFFWVALLVTFTGLPIASLMISTAYNISSKDKVILVLLSTMISFFIAHYIELNNYTLSENVFIFISVLFLSSYEIVKRYFLNLADFVSIFIASSLTLVLFLFLFSISSDNAGYILFFCYMSLLLPIIFLYIFKKQKKVLNYSTLADVFKGFLKYTLSNMASTSLMFALPIVLVAEIGDSIAADLAKIFYFSSLLYLIPHYLSAKHIPNMRKQGIKSLEVKDFFTTILKFVIIAIIISGGLFYSFYEQWLIYFTLVCAMQVSQLSLPFSNVLMVKGRVDSILKANLLSMSLLMIFISVIFNQMEVGGERAEVLLIGFLCFQMFKFYLSYAFSKRHFN
tara:strand:- start:3303 stop:4430 length:1128 start_codon:yes stop_codon:yes gene_type:complete